MKRIDVLGKISNEYKFVVEIGAGPTPFHATRLIVDKYPFDNYERSADMQAIAPVVKADAAALPFLDKSVDLLFMSQVIEHLPDPLRFLKEAKRVARDIYLESPSPVREVIFGWSFHKWVIRVEGNKWIFYKNDLPQLCGGYFHNESDVFFLEYTANNFDKFNNYFYGSVDKLEFEMATVSASEYLSQLSGKVDFPAVSESPQRPGTVKSVLYLLGKNLLPSGIRTAVRDIVLKRKNPDRIAVPDFKSVANGKLMCVSCHRPISSLDRACECGAIFKQINGIYSFDLEDYRN